MMCNFRLYTTITIVVEISLSDFVSMCSSKLYCCLCLQPIVDRLWLELSCVFWVPVTNYKQVCYCSSYCCV